MRRPGAGSAADVVLQLRLRREDNELPNRLSQRESSGRSEANGARRRARVGFLYIGSGGLSARSAKSLKS